MPNFAWRTFWLVTALLLQVGLGTTAFHTLESLSWLDAFYFTLVTITTVGYGDITAATPAGKILVVVLVLTGVGTFLGVVANVTETLLTRRERKLRMDKLHTVIGLFFSEIGFGLLNFFVPADPRLPDLQQKLLVQGTWDAKAYRLAADSLTAHPWTIAPSKIQIPAIRNFLMEKSDLLLRMLENPVILEREVFTDLLRAVFHLMDELRHRRDPEHLLPKDLEHIALDIQRVYAPLARHWLEHLRHLQKNYPYFFSLAARTNPFDPNAKPEFS